MAVVFGPARGPAQKSSTRYRNPFRWRVMPPDGASKDGFYDRSFSNKPDAVAYQKRVKAKYPGEPVCLIDTGRWYDSLGRMID